MEAERIQQGMEAEELAVSKAAQNHRATGKKDRLPLLDTKTVGSEKGIRLVCREQAQASAWVQKVLTGGSSRGLRRLSAYAG